MGLDQGGAAEILLITCSILRIIPRSLKLQKKVTLHLNEVGFQFFRAKCYSRGSGGSDSRNPSEKTGVFLSQGCVGTPFG